MEKSPGEIPFSQIITTAIPDDLVTLFLDRRLQPLLPHSLPLYRRCQFHIKQTANAYPASPLAEIFLAVPNSSGKVHGKHWIQPWLHEDQADYASSRAGSEEWLAAHIDLSNPGETQIWVFSSWENTFMTSPQPPARSPLREALFGALYDRLRNHHIPALPTEPSARWQTLVDTGKIVSLPYSRSKVLFGTISEALWPYLQDDVVRSSSHVQEPSKDTNESEAIDRTKRATAESLISREDKPYLKYIIDSSALRSRSAPPAGFEFKRLADSHLQLMLDRTKIPRTLPTLQSLLNVALYSEGNSTRPVAWGMLGKDASISSLHTESDYRGRGFAEIITKRLIEEQNNFFGVNQDVQINGEDGLEEYQYPCYAHTDVSTDNVASKRVFEKLGAQVRWCVGWVEIDVNG